METQKKAKELVNKFIPFMHSFHDTVALKQAKECALITISEVLNDDWYLSKEDCQMRKEFWEEVKNEIAKLQ